MRYWLSFDLGLRGNYEELYEWLDNVEAVECGEGTASFVTSKTRDLIIKELKKILDKNARVYIISKYKSKYVGKFVLGKRKKTPWAGYGGLPIGEEEEEEEEEV